MADGLRFPDDMPELGSFDDNSKVLVSDYLEGKKAKWFTFTALKTWISGIFAKLDASNLTDTDNIDLWIAKLNQAWRSDKIGDATTISVDSLSSGGFYKTGTSTSDLPNTTRTGIIQLVKGLVYEIQNYYTNNGSDNEIWIRTKLASGTYSDWTQINSLSNGILDLTPLTSVPYKEGRLFYDASKNSMAYYNDNDEVTINIGQEILFSVENNSGADILNGKVITTCATGICLADRQYKDKSRLIAVATTDIPDNSTGYVCKLGQVGGLNTSMYSIGQILYLGNDGEFAIDPPDDGAYTCIVGVVDVVDVTEGIITVDTRTSDLTVEVTDTNGLPADQRTNTIMSVVDATRTFSIMPTDSEFHFYELGDKYESTGDSVVFTNEEGDHWIFFEDGILVSEYNPTLARKKHIILNHAFISSIYWNATDLQVEIDIIDERHGIGMSPATHLQQHLSQGAFWEYGFLLGDITLGSGSLDVDAQFSVSEGAFYDEDIEHISDAKAVGFTGTVCFNSGVNGDLRTGQQTDFSVLNFPAGRLYYNEWTGTSWALTEVGSGDFVLYHDFGFNGQTENFITVMGQNEYTIVGDAREGAATEISNIISQLPFPEMIPIATRIYQTKDNYANSVKARIVADAEGNSYVNWLGSELTAGNSPSSHLNLTDVQQAGTGVTQGHISDTAQIIVGEKTLTNSLIINVDYLSTDGIKFEDGVYTDGRVFKLANSLRLLLGATTFQVKPGSFSANQYDSGSAAILTAEAQLANPNIVPDLEYPDTGIGGDGDSGVLSLVVNNVGVMYIEETLVTSNVNTKINGTLDINSTDTIAADVSNTSSDSTTRTGLKIAGGNVGSATDGTKGIEITMSSQSGFNYAIYSNPSTSASGAASTFSFYGANGRISNIDTYSTTIASGRDLYIDSTGLIGYISSIRESKTNIVDISDTSWIYDIIVREFNYRKKDTDDKGNVVFLDTFESEKQYGLIYDEVEPFNKNVLYEDVDEDGTVTPRGVNYSKFIPVLIKEVQNLKSENDELKAKLDLFEYRLNALESD